MAASASILPSNPTVTAKLPTVTVTTTTTSLRFPSNSPNYPSLNPSFPILPFPISTTTSPPSLLPTPLLLPAPAPSTASATSSATTSTPTKSSPPNTSPSSPPTQKNTKKLGSYALIGLPLSYQTRFVEPGQFKSNYSIVIGGDNFGCGSSREHAPVALGAAGVAAVVAKSYARIFFRNSVATGEIYPLESEGRLCEECRTGDVVTIELGDNKFINHTTGKEYKLKPIGDAGPVIEAGGIFAYARNTGMIPSRNT